MAPGRLVDRPCDVAPVYAADCYWFEVPERRDVADARMIRLWVAVIHHDGPDAAPTPRIHLPGGPGFPASTGWVAGTIELDPRDSRTIVVVDERGTGRSEPQLACPEFDEAIPTTAPYEDRVADHHRLATACRHRLESDGVDLDGYDTVESAADFVELRHALGIDQFVAARGQLRRPSGPRDLPPGPRRGRRAPPRQPGDHRASRAGQPDHPRRRRHRPPRRRLRRPTGMRRHRIRPRQPRRRRRPPRPAALPGAAAAHRRRVRPLRGVAGDVPLRPHPRPPGRARPPSPAATTPSSTPSPPNSPPPPTHTTTSPPA